MKVLSLTENSSNTSFKSLRVSAKAQQDLAKIDVFYKLADVCARKKSKKISHPVGEILRKEELEKIRQLPLYKDVLITKTEYKEMRFHKNDMFEYIQQLANSAFDISQASIKKVLPDIENAKTPSELIKAKAKAREALGLFNFKPRLYPAASFRKAS